MTADALLVLHTLFSVIWQLFNSWYIPGTNVTPAAFAVFLLATGLGLRAFKYYFGENGSAGGGNSDGS